MYENGELDFAPNFAVKDDPSHPFYGDLNYASVGGLGWFVAFDISKPPFEDPKVRAALAHAVDMPPITQAIYGDPTAAGIINGDLPCIDPDKAPYKFDPDLARQLLAESTYKTAANLPPITISVRRPKQIQIQELTQESWRDVLGVELNIMRREPGQVIPPEANIYRRSSGTLTPDVAVIMNSMAHSEGPMRDLSWHLSGNARKIDALLDKALSLPLDDPGRCDAFIAAERASTAEYRFIPNGAIGGGIGNYLVAPWVLGFESPSWYGDWTNVPYFMIGKRDRSLYPDYSLKP
jgi:oligopeptide transport system substrate-binding protein